MGIFSKLKRRETGSAGFIARIGFFIRWAEWIVKFVTWAITALRSFPPPPKDDETEPDEKQD